MTTIEDAIRVSIRVIRQRGSVDILKHALMQDGFEPERADTIIRWAIQINKKEIKNERHNHVR